VSATPPRVLLVVLASIAAALEASAQIPDGVTPSRSTDRRTDAALAAATALGLLAVFEAAILGAVAWEPAALLRDVLTLTFGAALFVSGAALRVSAIATLGEHFVFEARVTPEQPLVERGLYARMRHPSETGLLAMSLGAALLTQSTTALAIG